MTIGRIAHRIGRPQAAHAVILLYHRVAESPIDPFRLAVSPKRFEQQLELLRSRYRVTTLDALLGELDHPPGDVPAVVVTFDDGYEDNLEAAAPIAASLGIPITVFVTVGAVLGEAGFWWDELAELVCSPDHGETLTVSVQGRRRRFRTSGENERLRACIDLHRMLRPLPESSRRRVLDEVEAGRAADSRRPAHGRPLTEDELRRLDRLPGVTIGSHTVSHPALTSLAPADREGEIAGSRATLEKLLGHEVGHFSYPYGRGSDLDAATVRMAAAAGYRAACTTVQAAVAARSRPHELPRLTVLDWTPEQLARTLERLLPQGQRARSRRT